MVNEERMRHMIKMAQFDEREGKQCKPMTQYARKDYVSLQLLISFVTGTMAYCLIFGILALHSIDELFEKINKMDLQGTAMMVIVSYLLYMIFYMGATYIIYHMKYTNGRRKVKEYYTSVKKVNQMYEREERLKANTNPEWD